MNRKQLQKVAKKLMDLETKHNDPNISPEERSKVESEMLEITQKIASMPGGLASLEDIDEYIQENFQNI